MNCVWPQRARNSVGMCKEVTDSSMSEALSRRQSYLSSGMDKVLTWLSLEYSS